MRRSPRDIPRPHHRRSQNVAGVLLVAMLAWFSGGAMWLHNVTAHPDHQVHDESAACTTHDQHPHHDAPSSQEPPTPSDDCPTCDLISGARADAPPTAAHFALAVQPGRLRLPIILQPVLTSSSAIIPRGPPAMAA